MRKFFLVLASSGCALVSTLLFFAFIIILVTGLFLLSNSYESTPSDKEEHQREIQNSVKTIADSTLTFTVDDVTFTMIWVKGGTYTMGATSEQGSDAWDDEKPAHSETVGDFFIGETEVTQDLWLPVMGGNPSSDWDRKKPVEGVSWYDCQTFVNKLNRLLSDQLPAGRKFRLPTEAEWEYAARGGNRNGHYKYSGSNNINNVACYYESRYSSDIHKVKSKICNELGIYDMSGNVCEWCQDMWRKNYKASYDASLRVLRGGDSSCPAEECRVSYRTCYKPNEKCVLIEACDSLPEDTLFQTDSHKTWSSFNYFGLRLAL